MNRLLLTMCIGLLPQLAVAQPAVDQFGDPLPDGAIARLGTIRWRAEGPIALAAMLDAQNAVTVTENSLVQVWDLATGKELRRFEMGNSEGMRLPRGSMRSIVASRDGRRIAYTDGRFVQVWEVATGKKLASVGGGLGADLVVGVSISDDGGTLAVASMMNGTQVRKVGSDAAPVQIGEAKRRGGFEMMGGLNHLSADGKTLVQVMSDRLAGDRKPTMIVWDAETGKEKQRLKDLATGGDRFSMSSTVLVSPDMSLLAFPTGNTVAFVNVKDGKEAGRVELGGYDERRALAFAPDGKSLIVASGPGEPLSVYEVPSGKALREIGKLPKLNVPFRRFVSSSSENDPQISVAPDGKSLLWCSGSSLTLLDLETGKTRNEAAGHVGPVAEAFFDANGTEVYTRGNDSNIRRWDAKTGKVVDQLKTPTGATWSVLSPDGKWFATFEGRGVRLVDAVTLKTKHSFASGERLSLAQAVFSPDSRSLALILANRTVEVIDVATGEKRAKFQHGEATPADNDGGFELDGVRLRMNFSPDGGLLTISSDRLVTVWEIAHARQIGQVPLGEETLVHALISPDARTLALETTRGTSLLELATLTKRLSLHRNIAAKPRERIIRRFGRSDDEGSNSPLAFSPDGRLLARAGQDRKLRVFDTWTGREAGSFEGHRGDLLAAAFSPDGRRLVSASTDTTAIVWDTAPLREKLTVPAAPFDEGAAEVAWSTLLEHDAARAYGAIRTLTADPAKASAFLHDLIEPAAGPDSKVVAKLIADLGSPKFAVREKAGRELDRLGEGAASAVREAAEKDPSAEVRKAAKKLLDNVGQQPLTRDQVRAIRAVEILERLGTPAAAELLRKLAGGPAEMTPTPQAKAALARIEANKKNAWPPK